MIEKMFRNIVVLGVLAGTLFVSSVVGAADFYIRAGLTTRNPLTSAPQGCADTVGYRTISAKCTARKGGTSNSQYVTKNVGTSGGSVETEWVSGPTWRSYATTFKSNHTGYNKDGTYQSTSLSKSY